MYKVGNEVPAFRRQAKYGIENIELRTPKIELRRLQTSNYPNALLGTLYFVLRTISHIFAHEMKNNAATLTFSLPAQVHHLLHHFHHSS